MQKIKIAIVDDHTLFRDGITNLVEESNEIEVIFGAANGEDLIKKLSVYALPEVILMDINMPVMDGYATTKWVKTNYPSVNVLALSMFEDDKPIIAMLKNGAGGYMLKESKSADLIHAIKTIARQGYFINDLVSEKLMLNILSPPAVTPKSNTQLSANETRFLELCCTDLTYKQIADQMHLSSHTIDNYREALFQKFEVKSRTGLVIYALKNGLIGLV